MTLAEQLHLILFYLTQRMHQIHNTKLTKEENGIPLSINALYKME